MDRTGAKQTHLPASSEEIDFSENEDTRGMWLMKRQLLGVQKGVS